MIVVHFYKLRNQNVEIGNAWFEETINTVIRFRINSKTHLFLNMENMLKFVMLCILITIISYKIILTFMKMNVNIILKYHNYERKNIVDSRTVSVKNWK